MAVITEQQIAVSVHGNLCFGNDKWLCVISALDMEINLGYKIHLNVKIHLN